MWTSWIIPLVPSPTSSFVLLGIQKGVAPKPWVLPTEKVNPCDPKWTRRGSMLIRFLVTPDPWDHPTFHNPHPHLVRHKSLFDQLPVKLPLLCSLLFGPVGPDFFFWRISKLDDSIITIHWFYFIYWTRYWKNNSRVLCQCNSNGISIHLYWKSGRTPFLPSQGPSLEALERLNCTHSAS